MSIDRKRKANEPFKTGATAAGGGLHWIAMSVGNAQPPEPRSRSRGGREAKPLFVPELPASNAVEALSRLTFPPEVISGVARYMTPGASLMISDLGMSGETNKSTDFILVTR